VTDNVGNVNIGIVLKTGDCEGRLSYVFVNTVYLILSPFLLHQNKLQVTED